MEQPDRVTRSFSTSFLSAAHFDEPTEKHSSNEFLWLSAAYSAQKLVKSTNYQFHVNIFDFADYCYTFQLLFITIKVVVCFQRHHFCF